MNPQSRFITGAAVVALAVTGLIHFIDAPGAFGEITYKGVLFVANGLGAMLALIGILRGAWWGWLLGLAVTAGAMVGYIWSRTVGLPGLPPEPQNWLEPLGVVSLAVEALFIILFAATRRSRRAYA